MKKLYQQPRWKRYSKKRSRRQVRQRQGQRGRRASQRQSPAGPPRASVSAAADVVAAPTVFSLIKNPEASARFLARLAQVYGRGRSAYIDLRAVEELTSDAVLVLVSRLKDPRFLKGGRVFGSEPKATAPKDLLQQAGFFEFFRAAELKEPPEHGRIRRKSSFKVEPEVADELVRFATRRVAGQEGDRKQVYATLLECMANTHEHAARPDSRESWWAN